MLIPSSNIKKHLYKKIGIKMKMDVYFNIFSWLNWMKIKFLFLDLFHFLFYVPQIILWKGITDSYVHGNCKL